jgi:hypothetical protein
MKIEAFFLGDLFLKAHLKSEANGSRNLPEYSLALEHLLEMGIGLSGL